MRDLRFWRWRRAQDDDIDRELEVHLDLAAAERFEAGIPLREDSSRRIGTIHASGSWFTGST